MVQEIWSENRKNYRLKKEILYPQIGYIWYKNGEFYDKRNSEKVLKKRILRKNLLKSRITLFFSVFFLGAFFSLRQVYILK
jgi:hypothetical protein